MGFFDKLEERISLKNTILCLGLDPRLEEIDKFSKTQEFEKLYQENFKDKKGVYKTDKESRYVRLKLYCLHIVNNALDHVCSIKPNFAFFLAHSTDGLQVLLELCELLRDQNVPIILDCKLGDIGSTTEYYKKFIFEQLRADSCTVNTFMGTDVLKSLCSNSSGTLVHDAFVLSKCSNPSSEELQGASLSCNTPVFLQIIHHSQSLLKDAKHRARFGYVVGANCIEAIKKIREFYDCYLLIPGVGAQGGDLQLSLKFGLNKDGRGLVVPISRAITDTDDPGKSALYWKNEINSFRQS